MAERDDETGLPLPPKPAAAPEPHVHPPMPPSFAPELPPAFRSRRVDASDAPPSEPPYEDAARRMPHGPPSSWSGRRMFTVAVAVIAFIGFLVLVVFNEPASPQATQGTSGMEQTIELPPGQRLIHAEIGQCGEVYYRYAPLQPGEQPRNSTVEGRWSDGSSVGKIHFIERVAE